jgi:molecular chaperone GrpE
MEEIMYRNLYNQPGYKIPVRRAPIGGVSPYSSRPANPVEPEIAPAPQPTPPVRDEAVEDRPTAPVAEETDWQAAAQRLQADMDNFRKRQTRRADEAIAAERERLLGLVLPLADNLDRALRYNGQQDNGALRQGVELTQRELMRLLAAEGVSRIEAVGQPFTPTLHEALTTVPAQAEPNTVVEEVEAGYMLGDKLLRPAKVVVAA